MTLCHSSTQARARRGAVDTTSRSTHSLHNIERRLRLACTLSLSAQGCPERATGVPDLPINRDADAMSQAENRSGSKLFASDYRRSVGLS